jgi:hypothetical protein
VERAWRASLGKRLKARREVWMEFLEKHPGTPYRHNIEATINELDERIGLEAERASMTPAQRHTRIALAKLKRISSMDPQNSHGERWLDHIVVRPPSRAYEGSAVPIAVFIQDPTAIGKAWLYYRVRGDQTYDKLELRKDGDGYLRGEIAGEHVAPPVMDYFVEAVLPGEDRPEPIFGRAEDPVSFRVDSSAEEEPPSLEGHSQISLFVDYVDFDGISGKFDQYTHAEVDFKYRFFEPIYSLRLGFGTMNGTGGPKDVIDASENCTEGGVYLCHDVGYNYAYSELEKRFSELFALMLRVQWGSASMRESGGGPREYFSAFGARGRIRFGRELESNLVLGVASTQRLGKLFEGAFTWDVIPTFPMVLGVQVTDQPVIEDYGVRIIADVGLRKYSWVYPSIRMAYQARDIDHAGASVGFAANFDW